MSNSNPIPIAISNFIREQSCATICTVNENHEPYCFSCLYAYDDENNCIYFKSQDNTTHIQNLNINSLVSGSILEDRLNINMIRGIQFTANVIPIEHGYNLKSDIYYLRIPIAHNIPGKIWQLRFIKIKLTDNSKGFGYKTIWKK